MALTDDANSHMALPVHLKNNHDEYISNALNPSMSKLREVQSAVHVQLKPSNYPNKTSNINQEKAEDGWVKG